MSRWMNRLAGRVHGWFDSKEARPALTSLPARFDRRARLALQNLEDRSVPATFTVLNTADSGPGSLRQAVTDANTAAGADLIDFNTNGGLGTDFSSGPHTIALLSTLPQFSATSGQNLTITGPGADKLIITRDPTVTFSRAMHLSGPNVFAISDLTISGMSGTTTGSAIFFNTTNSAASKLTLNRVNISGNTATSGSPLYLGSGVHTVLNSTLSGNSSGSGTGGGAIRALGSAAGSSLTLENSTIFNNTSSSNGGGICITTFTGTLTIRNSTIVNNTATTGTSAGVGGGAINRNTTTAVTLAIENSIIANNKAADAAVLDISLGGTLTVYSATNSVIGVLNKGGTVTGSATDPLLSGLGIYGGSTPSMLPLAGSPALNLYNPGVVGADQRGQPRPATSADAGATERQAVEPPTFTPPTLANVSVNNASTNPYVFTVDFLDINTGTLGNDDIRILGPGGFNQLASFISSTPISGGVTAKYQFTPPGGTWNAADNGLYSVGLEAGKTVSPAGGNSFANALGSFRVGFPQTFTVNTIADSGPGSLRQAILDANALFGTADIINFDPSVFSGPSTIAMIAGDGFGQYNVTDSLTIDATGVGPVIVDGALGTRHFNINDNGAGTSISVTLRGFTLQGGNGSTGLTSPTAADGGSLVIANEIVVLENMTIQNNIVTSSNDGGAIDLGDGGNLTIRNSTLSGNSTTTSASTDGGAIYMGNGGSLILENSTISGNSNNGRGGAIYFDTGTVNPGTLTIRNSTISGNITSSATGTGGGGGIFVQGTNGTVIIQNSTIVNNVASNTVTTTAGAGGGGISITSATIGFSVESSVIALNSSANGRPDIAAATTGGVTVVNSAVGDAGGFTLAAASKNNLAFGLNLKFGGLGDNGGKTFTHLPDADSPLLDKGSNPAGLTTDQRGGGTDTVNFPRAKGSVDIGAVEAGVAAIPTATPTLTNVDSLNKGQTLYTFTVKYADTSSKISVATLDSNDIRVTNPGIGFDVLATFVSVDVGTDGTPRVATYKFTPPSGSWDAADTGTYTVAMESGQVTNTAGTPVTAGPIGSITVAIPQIFTVTSTGDSGAGSLRQAILDANDPLNPLADTIVFDVGFSSTVTAIFLSGTELLISDSLTIVGPGADKMTINAGNASRVLNISNASAILNVSISGLAITGGKITGDGGGIQTNNEKVTLQGVHIYGNSASSDGGGLATADGAQLTILDSAITGNTAATSGGGAYINNSAVSVILVRNTTISGNTAVGTTGGGGVNFSFATGDSITFQNSTITQNVAQGSGADGGGIRISSSSGKMTLESTLVAGNTMGTGAAFGPDIAIGTTSPTFGTLNATKSAVGTADGYNKGTDVGNIAPGTSLNFSTTLANNGGLLPTHAILPGSPLINAGSNPAALANDARGPGFAREVPSGSPDIGAYERVPGDPSAVAGPLPVVDVHNYTTANPYTFTVTYSDDVAINHLTIDGSDILVNRVGGGFSVAATLVSLSPPGTSTSPIIATYKFSAPGGSWDIGDNGMYTLDLQASQVKNTGGGAVAPGTLGTVTVAAPDVFTVTNADDSGPGSLRDALSIANTTPLADLIVFDPAFAGTVKTLTLGGAELLISESVVITGPGADKLTISGNSKSRILNISNASAILNVTVSGLGFTRGAVTGAGGAIQTNNEVVTLQGVNIFGNSASTDGGGIATADGAMITLLDSALTGNTAGSSGGGAYLNNSATSVILVRNSTISGNLALSTVGGGGFDIAFNAGDSITFENSTVVRNTAVGSGADGGGIRISSSSGVLNLISTVVADNVMGTGTVFGPDIAIGTSVGTVGKVNATNSAIGTTEGYTFLTNTGNIPAGTPLLLGNLNHNGGPTPTVGFESASPLREAGANPAALTFDQRGSARTVGAIDIGAFEMIVGEPHSTTASYPDLVGIPTPSSKPYSFTVTYFNDSTSNIDVGTLNTGDVRVYGPGGFSALATFKSVDIGTNGSPRVATYELSPPGGTWDVADCGAYTVSVEANQVKSSGGTAAPASFVGSFRFVIPQTFVVTNVNDSGPGSLRQAVLDSDLNAGVSDFIAFEATTFSTPQIIPVIGEIAISDSVTILGPGKNLLTLSGGLANRIFNINGSGTLDVTIQDLKLADGSIAGAGGAVVIQDENVTFLRTIFNGNQATTNGGAISVTTPLNSTLTILDSVLTGNSATTTASGDGGAIRIGSPAAGNTGHLIVRNSDLSNNSAMDDGGAILLLTRTSLLLENSTVSGNFIGGAGSTSTTPDGAAIYFIGIVGSPGFTIRNSTISGNSAGTGNNNSTSVSSALGLPLVDGAVLIQNSTIVNNTASTLSPDSFDGGGGIAISNAAGSAGLLTLESSIVADNSSLNGHPDLSSQSPVVAIHSAIGAGGGHAFDAASAENIAYGVDLKLGALQNNGGPSFTHLPAADSPLLDRGSNPAALTLDQRGLSRTKALTDIGAAEAGQSLVPFGFSNAPAAIVGAATYTFTVKYYDTVTGINNGTVDDGDELRVTGPGGFDVLAKFVSVDNAANGSPRTATYSFTTPGGAWDNTDNGVYSIDLQANQVKSVGNVAANPETLALLTVGFPATLTVTNTDDSGPGSLRDTIAAANATPEADLIVFSPLFNTAQTITLTGGELLISEAVTVDGPGANLLTVSGNNASRVFKVSNASTQISVTIRDIKVTGGLAVGGTTSTQGGGIDTTNENVTIDSLWITGNTSTGVGGGIAASLSGNLLTILNSTIDNNVAQNGDTTYGGGGIHTQLTDGLVIRNTTVTANTAVDGVGGGLGVYSGTVSVTIDNSTFTNNTSLNSGGGMRFFSGTYPIIITNTVIAGNNGPAASKDLIAGTATLINSAFGAADFTPGAGTGNNIGDAGLDLGPLQNNGGPTPTIAIGNASTARNAGTATSSLAFDQRGPGFPRLVGPAVDIGAFENQTAVAPAVTGFTVNNGAAQRSRLTTITITFNQPVTVAAFNTLGAITLTRTAATPTGTIGTIVQTGAAGANGLITVSQPGPANQLVLTFSNANSSNETAGVEYGSLADGRWQLAIGSAGFTSTLGDPTLRRLFGDFEAGPGSNGTVDAGDFAQFGTAFGSSGPLGFSPFDYDNNGTIDSGDLGAVGARFGFSV